jgi:hypothetical protein
MNAVTGLVAVALASGGCGSRRLTASTRATFFFRHQAFDLRARIDFVAVLIDKKPGNVDAKPLERRGGS